MVISLRSPAVLGAKKGISRRDMFRACSAMLLLLNLLCLFLFLCQTGISALFLGELCIVCVVYVSLYIMYILIQGPAIHCIFFTMCSRELLRLPSFFSAREDAALLLDTGWRRGEGRLERV